MSKGATKYYLSDIAIPFARRHQRRHTRKEYRKLSRSTIQVFVIRLQGLDEQLLLLVWVVNIEHRKTREIEDCRIDTHPLSVEQSDLPICHYQLMLLALRCFVRFACRASLLLAHVSTWGSFQRTLHPRDLGASADPCSSAVLCAYSSIFSAVLAHASSYCQESCKRKLDSRTLYGGISSPTTVRNPSDPPTSPCYLENVTNIVFRRVFEII
ncbi:hypothetical protein KC329_g127 [Hortaea werneckii]|nr:hypothetical protein KC329_g127 [Hortaea werneckii]